MRRWGKRVLLGLVVVLVAAQFVPVKRDNPAIDPSKTFYSVQTVPADIRAAFDRSCKDCHSNETVWPWYSYLAPVSWVVAHDVHDGRGELNLSEWENYNEKRKGRKLFQVCEQLRSGEMPDWKYTLIHRNALLSQEERNSLCAWAETTRKSFPTEVDGAKSPGSGATH
jgi:hypothetical protein